MLAGIHQNMGDWETAVQCYHQSEDLFEQLSETALLARLYLGWGRGLLDRGETRRASEMWQKALALFSKTGLDKEVAQVEQLLSVL